MSKVALFFGLLIISFSCSEASEKSGEKPEGQILPDTLDSGNSLGGEHVLSSVDTIVLNLRPCNIFDLAQFIDAPVVTSSQVKNLLLQADAKCDLRNVEFSEVYNEAVNKALLAKPRVFFSSYCLVSNKNYIESIVISPISDQFIHDPSSFREFMNECPAAKKLIASIEGAYSKY